MRKNLWDSFVFTVEASGSNSIRYYRNLKSWFNQQQFYFSEDILKSNRLNILLNLDPLEYEVSEKGYSALNWRGLEESNFKKMKLDTFVMLVSDEMWDMVTTIRGKQCPKCDEDEMRYIFIKTESSEKDTLILECYRCGYCEYLNGNRIESSIQIVRPAKRIEIPIHLSF